MGEDCSQPPDGVAETMLPQRSTTSMWHVSPRVAPVCSGESGSAPRAEPVETSTVGSPTPAAAPPPGAPGSDPAGALVAYSVRSTGTGGVARPGTSPGRTSWLAVSVISPRRSAAYSSLSR